MVNMRRGLARVNTHVYGLQMNERLSKADWVRQGLRTLTREGVNGLKIGAMAEKLKVSRGSFYWHFRDLADFQAQVLESWQDHLTDQVIRGLEARPVGPDRLRHLLRQGFDGALRLDRAIRSWAAQDKAVAAIVAAVDARRVAYIAKLLVGAGVPTPKAQARAVFLYWAYLGQSMVMEPRHGAITPAALDDIGDLFER